MKIFKKKMIWCSIMAIAGITLNFVSILQGVSSSTITGFALGLAAVSIVKLIQFYRISKNSQIVVKLKYNSLCYKCYFIIIRGNIYE